MSIEAGGRIYRCDSRVCGFQRDAQFKIFLRIFFEKNLYFLEKLEDWIREQKKKGEKYECVFILNIVGCPVKK